MFGLDFVMLKYQFCRLGTINTGLWKLFKCDVAITWHIQNIHTVCVSMQQVYMLGGGGSPRVSQMAVIWGQERPILQPFLPVQTGL